MYGHYKLNVWSIQMKCMVITSEMYSHYKPSYIQFLTLGGSHDHLYKPSKFPFLEISSQTISCGCLHKPSKFPFLVFPYMVSHMIITTHPVPLYPRFLPNWKTLLNQVTGSFPPTEWLIIQEKGFPPLWWIKKPRDNFLIIQRSSLKMIQKLIRTTEFSPRVPINNDLCNHNCHLHGWFNMSWNLCTCTGCVVSTITIH